MDIEGITIVAADSDEYWFALGAMWNRGIPSAGGWSDYSFFGCTDSWETGLTRIAEHGKEVNILMRQHFRFRRNVRWNLLHRVICHVLCGNRLHTSWAEQVKDWNPIFQAFYLTAQDSPDYVPTRSIIAPGAPPQSFGAVAVTPQGAETLLAVENGTVLTHDDGIWHSRAALVERSDEVVEWKRTHE